MKCLSKILFLLLVIAVSASGQDEAAVGEDEGTEIPQTPTVEEAEAERSLTRDEELYLLKLQQAELDVEQAKVERAKALVELDKVRLLFEKQLETIEKLNEAEQKHGQAVVKHEQAQIELSIKRLEFLKGATLVTVVDAKKYRNKERDIMVSVTLRNDSDINKARVAMKGVEDLDDERLEALLKVDNVIVTLQGQVPLTGVGPNSRVSASGRAIVGDPYQQIVPALAYGEEVELEYRLLRKDLESVRVSLEFLGIRKDCDVFLKKESKQDLPIVTSTQYSQVGHLGDKIWYGLNLERLAKTDASFALVVLNLPPEIPFEFQDPGSKAILMQVQFTEERSEQSLRFQVSIPRKLKPELVGRSIPFYIVVTHPAELKNIHEIKKQFKNNVPPDEIAKLKGDGNKVPLILIPRGVGELEIIAPNLLMQVEQGQPIELKFRIWNSGTLALRQVTPELGLPIEWEGDLIPKVVEIIEGGEKELFKAVLRPPEDLSVGNYMVTIKAQGHGVDVVDALDKDFTVQVAAKSNITGTVVLVTVLVALVVGIAIASIKISRR